MRLVIINRGVPGSGKSTFINSLKETAPQLNVKVHSTDDLWMVDGKYMFDFKKLGEKHEKNYDNFCESLDTGVDIVFCDNTNIKARDYNKYVNASRKRGYRVIAVVFYPSDIKDHVARNTHDVPEFVLSRMRDELIKNTETSDFDQEFLIYPEQGGKNSKRIRNIIDRILKM